ncbi:MAG TPA: LytTR family DNA-binding domain-containing protein [Bacteroidia bacterium]|nr:LytTR family DNA-binding domain-containing protein [Bacteroidia bacterium]
MEKLRALLVDDERNALEGLTQLLKLYCPNVEIAATASSINEALDKIASVAPDIIFLDVYLPEGNGFDLVDAVKDNGCSLVFVTGHADHAAMAFRVDAVDYLLKPVSYKELRVAVSRAVSRREKERAAGTKENHRIRISATSGMRFIFSQDVVSVEADGRYSVLHMKDGEKHLVSRNIGEFEDELEPHGFFRVHKSWLINCGHVVRLDHVDGGTLELANGKKVLLSRRKKTEFLKRMEE